MPMVEFRGQHYSGADFCRVGAGKSGNYDVAGFQLSSCSR